MPAKYAARTRVSKEKTQGEFKPMLKRYGATQIMEAWSSGSGQGEQAFLAFRLNGVNVRLDFKEPINATAQQARQYWRVQLLLLQAKLEDIEQSNSTVEQQFMAYLLLPSGETVHDWLSPQLEDAHKSGQMPRALPGLESRPIALPPPRKEQP